MSFFSLHQRCLHSIVALLLKEEEVVGERASLLEQQVEILFTDKHRAHLTRNDNLTVGKQLTAVVLKVGIAGESLDYDYSELSIRLTVDVEIAHSIVREVVACHVEEQTV